MNDDKLTVDYELARKFALYAIASEQPMTIGEAFKDYKDALTITDVGQTGSVLYLDRNYCVCDSTTIDRHESYNTTIDKRETFKNDENNENQLQEQRNSLRGERGKEQGGLLCRIRKPRLASRHLKYKEISPRY